jgi:hypothetical protein
VLFGHGVCAATPWRSFLSGKEAQVGIRFVSHPTEDEWEEYAFGRLGENQLGRVEEHLLACASCQSTLESIDMMLHAMRSGSSQAVSMPPSRATRANPRIAGYPGT